MSKETVAIPAAVTAFKGAVAVIEVTLLLLYPNAPSVTPMRLASRAASTLGSLSMLNQM